MQTCDTCHYWARVVRMDVRRVTEGTYFPCLAPAMNWGTAEERVPREDGVWIVAIEGGLGFNTGPKFGCVHWTAKEEAELLPQSGGVD
jgi:hypothetical protein